MAMARLNRPALMVYGGTIRPGTSAVSGQPIDVISAFQSYGPCMHVPEQPGCGLFLHACIRQSQALQRRHGPPTTPSQCTCRTLPC